MSGMGHPVTLIKGIPSHREMGGLGKLNQGFPGLNNFF